MCASGETTFLSCKNVSFQNHKNTRNNPLVQHDDGKGGNSAEQSISQSRSKEQNSQLVSGGDTIGSGNIINVQNQETSGSSVDARKLNSIQILFFINQIQFLPRSNTLL